MPYSSKKAAAGCGSIRKKNVTRNGRTYTYWEARFTMGFDPSTGKQIQRSVTGSTQKEVRQKIQDAQVSIDAGTYIAPNKTTLSEWLDIWLTDYLIDLKPLTLQNYTLNVNHHIKPALGAVRLDSLKPHMIQGFYNSLINGQTSQLSAKTIKNIHGVLHQALQQAIANGYMRENPAAACILPKVQKPDITVLEPEQIASFLREATSDSYCNLFTVAMFTGMRQSELLGLSWNNIDFKNCVITVKHQIIRITPNGSSIKSSLVLIFLLLTKSIKDNRCRCDDSGLSAFGCAEEVFTILALNLVFTDALKKTG